VRGLVRIALVLLMGTAAGWPRPKIVGPAAASGDLIPPAVIEDHGHLRVLRLRGTAYQMGYQHGASERAAIRAWVAKEVYGRGILEAGRSHAVLLARAHAVDDRLPQEIRRELRGIADGAGLSYDDVLLLNLLLNRLSAREALPSPNLEALVFAAWADAASEEVLLGYRLNAPDLASRLRRHLLVAVYEPVDGQPYATLTWSGQVGAWCGLNRAGLGVCATPPGAGDGHTAALPPPLLTRWLLAHAQDGEGALRRAMGRDYLAAFHLLIADGGRGAAMAVRFGAHQHRIVESETGLLVLGPDHGTATSLLSRNAGWLDGHKAMAALASRRAPAGGEPGLCDESTLLNVLLAPGQGELWIGLDLWPASCRRYLRVGPFE
jgi:hypothetical protein